MSEQKQTVKIKLSTYGDEAAVAPSMLGDDRILVGFFAANGMPEHPQVFTPAEWDAFVTAGNAALGRQPVRVASPSERVEIPTAILIRVPLDPTLYPPEDVADLSDAAMIHLFHEGGYDDLFGDVAVWTVERGEQGPTVPRAAVEALRERWQTIASEFAAEVNRDPDLCLLAGAAHALSDVVAALDALLAPPAPTGDHRP